MVTQPACFTDRKGADCSGLIHHTKALYSLEKCTILSFPTLGIAIAAVLFYEPLALAGEGGILLSSAFPSPGSQPSPIAEYPYPPLQGPRFVPGTRMWRFEP